MVFFPTLVNGPLEVPRQMEQGWLPRGDRAALGAGAGRIAAGIAKLAVAGLAFRPGWTAVLGTGADAPAWQLWLWGGLFYLWFYLSFSAWTDVAVGFARLAGRRVPENFFHPWAATDPADFWRRWHASFGVWLRDYVYVPLGGARRRRALNVAVTFLVSALWHVWGGVKLLGLGFFPPHAWHGFVLWGVLNAAGVLAARPLRRLLEPAGALGRAVGRVVTTAFACWCWIPFFLPAGVSFAECLAMLGRMLWPF
jgi:alginate O-acetyltransferase complex protein AlgI